MYNSDHTATECIGQKNIFFLLPPQSVDVLSRFIYTALCCQLKGNLSKNKGEDQLDLKSMLHARTNNLKKKEKN